MNLMKNSRRYVGGLTMLIICLASVPSAIRAQVVQESGATGETDNKFPWVVNFQSTPGSCQGVLIAPTWVLTAAHCIGSFHNGGTVSYKRTNPVTGLKTSGSQQTGLNSTFIHPDYKEGSSDDDIALVRLPKPFPADPLLLPAELPTVGTVVGQRATVANSSHTQTLPAGQVAVLRGSVLFAGPKKMTARSANASLCPGDSGSGFVTAKQGLNVVIGIASTAVVQGCTMPGLEFDATDVYQHLGWITSIAGILPRVTIAGTLASADYDGDGRIDLSIKNALGEWKIDFANNGYGFWDVVFSGYGPSSSTAVPADYDGDGKTDLSVKTDSGTWLIDFAADGFGLWNSSFMGYGGSDALPVPADYDGDRKADLSVKTTAGVWYIDYSSNGFGAWNASFGGYVGSAVPANYDGDSRFDLSVKGTDGVWAIDYAAATAGIRLAQIINAGPSFGAFNVSYSGYGGSDNRAIPADYDGDRKADLSAKTDGGIWFIDFSSNGFGQRDLSFSGWGGSSYKATPADYDGDLKVDLAIYDRLKESWHIDFAKDGFGGARTLLQLVP